MLGVGSTQLAAAVATAFAVHAVLVVVVGW